MRRETSTDARGREQTRARRVAGAEIVAPVAGVVRRAYGEGAGSPRSGNAVTIEDADGWHHHLAHLRDRPLVSVGQRVTAGQAIGYLGNTGSARNTAPHLHYQIEHRGQRVNPYEALRLTHAALRSRAGTVSDAAQTDQTEARDTLAALAQLIEVAEGWDILAVADALPSVDRMLGVTLGDQIRGVAVVARVQYGIADAHRRRGEWSAARRMAVVGIEAVAPPMAEMQRWVDRVPEPFRTGVVLAMATLASVRRSSSTAVDVLDRATRPMQRAYARVTAAADAWAEGTVVAGLLVAGVAVWAMTRR